MEDGDRLIGERLSELRSDMGLSQQELETLAPVLDSAVQYVTYYDPRLKRLYEMDTYTGDWSTRNRNTFTNVAKANESFEISFIANRKR